MIVLCLLLGACGAITATYLFRRESDELRRRTDSTNRTTS